jgi:hypothetical protein
MQRLFTYCTPANMSDDLSLIELLSHNRDYFRALAGQYSEDYHPPGQRVSPGYNHRSSAKCLSPNPDPDSVLSSAKANQIALICSKIGYFFILRSFLVNMT